LRKLLLVVLLVGSLVLGLRAVGPAQASAPRILLLNLGDPETPGALQILNMSFVQVDASQFLTTNLNLFDVLFVGWDGSTSDPTPFNALLTRQADISNWIASGHGLVALAEPNIGKFSWLPLSVTIGLQTGDQVVITNPSHPIMANLTDTLLSNWHNSFHNTFLTWAPAYQTLAITPLNNLPITLAATLGSGRIAITGQDPDWHLFYQHQPGAAILLRNMINWAAGVSAAPPGEASLSLNPTVTAASKGSNFAVTVNVTSAFNLYSLDVFLTFDPSLLTGSMPVDSAGALRAYCLKTAGCTGVSSSFVSGPGFVEEKETLIGMVPGFAGNGTLFTVPFASAKGSTGTSVIHIATSSSGAGNGVIATGTGSQIQHFSVDGVFSDDGPDLFVSIVPNILTVGTGNTGISRVTLYSLNGLSGTVALTLSGVPAGVSANLNQTSLSLTSTSATTTLTILVSFGAPSGAFNLTVTGTITPNSHTTIIRSATLELVIPPPSPDFAVTVSSSSVNIPSGASGSVNITVSSISGFSAPVTLSLQGVPFFAGVSGSFIINPLTPPVGGVASSTLKLFVSQFQPPAIFPLTITASSPGITHSKPFILLVSGFNIFPQFSSLTIQPGGSASEIFSLNSVNNFSGTVQLSALLVPSNVTATFSATAIFLPPSSFPNSTSTSFTVTFQATPVANLGTFETVILGTSGPTFASAGIQLTLNDFSVALATPEIAVPITESATADVFLASLNGFGGLVSLQTSGAPTGVTASVLPTFISLNPGTTVMANVTVNVSSATTPRTFPLTITASSGLITRTTVLTVSITDFSIGTSVGSVSLKKSQSANVTLSVTSLNGFSAPVTLTVSGLPNGVIGTIVPSIVNPNGVSASSTLTITVPKKPPTGTFLLTITATSGSLTHTVTVTLTIL
jgi:hypothetical protein